MLGSTQDPSSHGVREKVGGIQRKEDLALLSEVMSLGLFRLEKAETWSRA